jgi:hypothetical protein
MCIVCPVIRKLVTMRVLSPLSSLCDGVHTRTHLPTTCGTCTVSNTVYCRSFTFRTKHQCGQSQIAGIDVLRICIPTTRYGTAHSFKILLQLNKLQSGIEPSMYLEIASTKLHRSPLGPLRMRHGGVLGSISYEHRKLNIRHHGRRPPQTQIYIDLALAPSLTHDCSPNPPVSPLSQRGRCFAIRCTLVAGRTLRAYEGS